MKRVARNFKYCIIGAGASGLAAAKNFRQHGIAFDCLEREPELGGLWNQATGAARVYKSTHMVSSKEFTWFEDYPMPEDYPLYPSHAQALAYLRDYAEHFGIMDAIEFETTVDSVTRDDQGWQVKVAGEDNPRRYAGVVIANGHHEVPRLPELPGRFDGDVMHSSRYRDPSQLAGKRVLVIGGGNSGCDVAVDAVHHAKSAIHSMRRGYYFLPRFLLGIPLDDVIDFVEFFRFPRWLRQRLYGLGHRLAVGPNWRYGLATPEHQILDTHPTVSAELPSLVAEGRLIVKPDIKEFSGRTVSFTDGSKADVDLVVCATGYRPHFPFIDKAHIVDDANCSKLHLNIFHPQWDDLFVVGLVNANGSMWRLADQQSKLVAGYLTARRLGASRAEKLRKSIAERYGTANVEHYLNSDRHRLEVDYFDYYRRLGRLIAKLKPVTRELMPPTAGKGDGLTAADDENVAVESARAA